MKTLKFANHYTKLNHPLFTTIRINPNLVERETVLCESPHERFKATVLMWWRVETMYLPEELLVYDVKPFATNRIEALDHLNKLHPKDKIDNLTVVTVLVMLKTEAGKSG